MVSLRAGRSRPRGRKRKASPLKRLLLEPMLVLGLLLLLGVKLSADLLSESSSVELLWLAGEAGYFLAGLERQVEDLFRWALRS